jgi:hypothetical protein
MAVVELETAYWTMKWQREGFEEKPQTEKENLQLKVEILPRRVRLECDEGKNNEFCTYWRDCDEFVVDGGSAKAQRSLSMATGICLNSHTRLSAPRLRGLLRRSKKRVAQEMAPAIEGGENRQKRKLQWITWAGIAQMHITSSHPAHGTEYDDDQNDYVSTGLAKSISSLTYSRCKC